MKRVMVVDDSEDIRKLCEVTLKKAGVTVVCVSSAEEGLSVLKSEDFDLLVVDVVMPGLSGFEFLERANDKKTSRKQTPAIMLTGKKAVEDVTKALSLGAIDYICKPFDHDIFVSKIQAVLGAEVAEAEVKFAVATLDVEAQVKIEGRIHSVTESGMTFYSKNELAPGLVRLDSGLLGSIGLTSLVLRVVGFEKTGEVPYPFKTTLSFVGLGEESLIKLRSWILRHNTRQRRAS